MAELLGADRVRECAVDPRHLDWHGAGCGGMHGMRCAFGARVRRWSATDGAAVLHEFGVTAVCEGGVGARIPGRRVAIPSEKYGVTGSVPVTPFFLASTEGVEVYRLSPVLVLFSVTVSEGCGALFCCG